MKKSQGFTLIELMITIAIMAIIAVIAVPSFGSVITRQHLKTTSYQMRDTLKEARSKAMLNQKETVVCSSKITQSECTQKLTDVANVAESLKKDSVYMIHLEKKITSPSTSDHFVLFSSRGNVTSTKTMIFCSSQGSYILSVGLSGRVEMTQGDAC